MHQESVFWDGSYHLECHVLHVHGTQTTQECKVLLESLPSAGGSFVFKMRLV